MNAVILHIPHASIFIPEDFRELYIASDEELAVQNLKLADLYTDEIYSFKNAARAAFPYSRFFVDVERFSDDAMESMAARGMGALYTVGTELQRIRNDISPEIKASIMDRYYWPHHNSLDVLARERLEAFGECLVFDCHSYPSRPLPYELERASLPRPEIGIGTDGFHTPAALMDAMAGGFRKLGYQVGVDIPFSGALVPNAYYAKDERVRSVMIEVRKDLYMDEATGMRSSNFDKVRADIALVMEDSALKTLKTSSL